MMKKKKILPKGKMQSNLVRQGQTTLTRESERAGDSERLKDRDGLTLIEHLTYSAARVFSVPFNLFNDGDGWHFF